VPSLLLVRHGQSTWNASGRWQGQADPPLSPLGQAQAAHAARRLADADLTGVVASDLARARQTAEIVAAALGLGDVTVDAGLRERDVGEWEGLTRAEIEERFPGLLAAWGEGRIDAPPGGEPDAVLAARAKAALGTLIRPRGDGDRILVVTHGGVIRALDASLGSDPTRPANLAGRWFQTDGNGSMVRGDVVVLVDPDELTASPSG
jgi:broad specificity phosphatase PhoE